MEIRTLLAIVLSLIVLVAFQFFFGGDLQPPSKQPLEPSRQTAQQEVSEQLQAEQSAQEGRKEQTLAEAPPSGDSHGRLRAERAEASKRPARDITVDTDLYHLVFSEQGAVLKQCLLKEYHQKLSSDSPPVDLVHASAPLFPLAVRLESRPPLDLSTALFDADQENLVLDGASGSGRLKFRARLSDGTVVSKIFIFHQGSYWIDVSVELAGPAAVPATISLYNTPPGKAGRYNFEGFAYHSGTNFEEVKLKNPGEKYSFTGPLDWIGYGDNYFLAALVPVSAEGPWNILVEKLDAVGAVTSQLTNPKPRLAGPSLTEALKLGLYVGPKEIDRLKALDHELSKAINFGWFDPIAKPLLYILKFFYRFLHNYGIAIIVVTVLIKIAFWPLAQKSAKSMKTMQKIQPKLAKLKEKYGDDKERLNREMMQLYKTYKVNPMGGCLPMVLQIPVFFALYRVLYQAIELRHAPFMLWINDLSAPDRLMIPGVDIPYLGGIPVLTILMGISMFLQQRMSPSSLDPTQAKMMQLLPVVFTFLFINFPSGLVLYWLINNVLSIGQQYYVNRYTS